MPRALLFQELSPRGPGSFSASCISPSSPNSYLVSAAKKHQGFDLKGTIIDRRYIHKAYLSNHLTPFVVNTAADVLLPFRHDLATGWQPEHPTSIAARGSSTKLAFGQVFAAAKLSDPAQLFALVNTVRNKLHSQRWSTSSWIVIFGAGGDHPCAAYLPPGRSTAGEVVFDQTLYWAAVRTEDEALYLTGAINSPALETTIKAFQPRGAQGARHVHKLPLGVTPPYNAADVIHAELVAATRLLVDAWAAALHAHSSWKSDMSPASGPLAQRRSRLAAKLQQLPEFQRYRDAAAALYDTN